MAIERTTAAAIREEMREKAIVLLEQYHLSGTPYMLRVLSQPDHTLTVAIVDSNFTDKEVKLQEQIDAATDNLN